MVKITSDPIDPTTAYSLIARESAGSVVFHYAVVKSQEGAGGKTCHIHYGTSGDTEGELQAILAEISGKWAVEDLLLIRRTGRVGIGEIISLVAASSPNSEDAFEACRLGIARLKKMKTIVKNEVCA